jgi:hypothetical protein
VVARGKWLGRLADGAATILSEPQITMDGTQFAPQIYGLPEDVDLVTVTAGGNDFRFIGSMLSQRGERF